MVKGEPVSNKSEFILCAAYKIDDLIFYGFRHKDCLYLAAKCAKNATKENSEAGFLTSKNRFVDRAEGFDIAKKENQIWHTLHSETEKNILTSEDLY
jgi:hypothetical protein